MKKVIKVEAVVEFKGRQCEPSCEHFYMSRNGEEKYCLLFLGPIENRRHSKCIETAGTQEDNSIITNVVNITKDMIVKPRKQRADKGTKRGPRAKKNLVHYHLDGSVEQPGTGGK